jgi:CelD/BcsL family acetyltransferase involved in cellulose biosynthesis
LHHARWEKAGETGVFRAADFLRFHDEIMPCLLDRGALELLWLSVRGTPVAALYGMVHQGKVLAYQIGRRPDVLANIRLGAVIVGMAIRSAIAAGQREFDLLGGVTQFKQQLALATRPLVQVRAFRPSWRERLRRLTEGGYGFVRNLRRRFTSANRGQSA